MNHEKVIDNWIIYGIPIVCILGSLSHFIFDWLPYSIVGAFVPVNESVWEHLKMAYWPILIWWIIGYFVLRNKTEVSTTRWFFSGTIAIMASIFIILSIYYLYTGAFNLHSPIIDIILYFLSIVFGLLIALSIYKKSHIEGYFLYISIAVLFIWGLAFIAFTYYPPHIPLFLDESLHQYGIVKPGTEA